MEPMQPTRPTQPTQPTRPMASGRGRRPGVGMMLGLRVVISLLAGALGVALLAGGSVVVGGILVALAVARLVMTGLMWNRRRRRREQIAAWRVGRG
jgi:predicted lysophospholipase L1 biosynthesis ABC-type transport system permease subunit